MKYDVIVIGLGAMGSASLYQLAKSGAKVLGIDMFTPPHIYGSSHGETRITRQAIAEGKEYVPLVLRANEIWHELENLSGESLYTRTGILIMASNTADRPNKFVDNTIVAASEYGIEHEVLSAATIAQRFPKFKTQGDEKGYFEPGAGYLQPEKCIDVQLGLAAESGAEIHDGERFISYSRDGDTILVTTDKAEYATSSLVLTMGPWVNEILPAKYRDTVKIYRQVLYWFEIDDPEDYASEVFPVFNWEFNTAHEDFMYGFPSLDSKTIKVATEQYDETTGPGKARREVTQQEKEAMYEQYVKPHLSGVSARCVKAESCLYSVAPDWRFLIDRHPDDDQVIVASPCSGHGFKHSAAIGEVIADMVLGRETKVDIAAFGFDRVGVA